MAPSGSYLVCCIERTGSNLLARALEATGLAGRPREYFNPSQQQKPWMREILAGCDIVKGMPGIIAAGTTPNGRFGAKLHWGHLRFLGMSITGEWDYEQQVALLERMRSKMRLLSPAAAREMLRSRFPGLIAQESAYKLLRLWLPNVRIIWLRRQNMVARAISLVRARQTNIWYQSPWRAHAPQANQPPTFDFEEIHFWHCLGGFQEECWQRLFDENGIRPHRVLYEDLASNYEATVRGVLKFLDCNAHDIPIPPPSSIKQSGPCSVEWEERYYRLRAAAGI